jgi:hypothetical protein
MLQRVSEQIAECLQQAAKAQDRADQASGSKSMADYERIAETWRKLACSYEIQGSPGRFISFGDDGRKATLPILAGNDRLFTSSTAFPGKEADLFDRLARVTDRIRRQRDWACNGLFRGGRGIKVWWLLRTSKRCPRHGGGARSVQ